MNKFVAIAAFGALAAASALVDARAADLVIGLSVAQTGPYVTNSRTNAVAVDLAVSEINQAGGINGNKLRVVKLDTAGDPKQAVVAVRKFAQDDNALAIVGPFSSSECRVSFPIGERLGIVQTSNASSAPGLTKNFSYAFRNTSDELTQFKRLLATMKKKGMPLGSASIIYATDDFISKIVGTRIYPAAFKQLGVAVRHQVGFPLHAFDLSPQVAQLMQSPADVVAIGGTVDAAIKVVTELRRQGHKGRILGTGTIADPDLPKKLGKGGDGTLYPTYFFHLRNDRVKQFYEKFKVAARQSGMPRDIVQTTDASAYDIVYMYAEAMRRAGVTGNPAEIAAERTAIRDQLNRSREWGFEGMIGKSFFGPEGDARMPTYVIEVRGGSFDVIDTHAGGSR